MNTAQEEDGGTGCERKILHLVERSGLLVSFWDGDSFLSPAMEALSLLVVSEPGLMRTVDNKDTPTRPAVGKTKVTPPHTNYLKM